MPKPLAIELYAGCHGWGEALVAEGFRVISFDIEHLPHHGPVPKGCELVLQDVRTLHGSQFKDAALIVASPPCQTFSYMAMPWTVTISRKVPGFNFHQHEKNGKGGSVQSAAVASTKNNGGSWFAIGSPGQTNVGQNPDGRKVPTDGPGRRTDRGKGARFTTRDCGVEAIKNGNDWFGSGADCSLQRRASSGSSARKAASAAIAKIPATLAAHIARIFKPHGC